MAQLFLSNALAPACRFAWGFRPGGPFFRGRMPGPLRLVPGLRGVPMGLAFVLRLFRPCFSGSTPRYRSAPRGFL